MISYYQDTQLEYRGGCSLVYSRQHLTTQRYDTQLIWRSRIYSALWHSGELYPNSGGSSE